MTLPTFHSTRLFAAACAVAFLLGHLPFLASTLEDVDSVNFALALRRFDVAAHRPHPPGYPLYVALGRLARPATAALMPPEVSADRLDARTLAVLGVISGALLAFPLLQLFRVLERSELRARAALLVTLACPLLWFAAARPLSDVVGLCAAAAAQALLLTAWRRQARSRGEADSWADPATLAASGRLIVLGALVAGLAIGVRSQNAWLTLPLLLAVIVDRAGRGAAGALLGASITFALGALLWAIPLLWATGGPRAYLHALTGQAGEDLSGVDMLARNPTVQRLAAGLLHTFVYPWQTPWIAVPVLGLGLLGLVTMLRRSRSGLAMLLVVAAPYALFHLVFQETFTTRYALPLVPVMAYLAVRGLSVAGSVALVSGTAGLVLGSLALTVPALSAYAAEGSPVARAVEDIRDGLARPGAPPRALVMNHPFAIALRDETFDAERLPSVRTHQWLEKVEYWRAGGTRPIWFMAEPGPNGLDRHHELTLIDRAARTLRHTYRWPFDPTTFVGGTRPSEVDWVELDDPGWFATGGWALTPEVAGVSHRDGLGPARGGVTAFVRRRPDAAVVLLGGRNLGGPGAPDVRFTATIDGRPVRSWSVPPQPGFFLDLWTLEAGSLAGQGRFASLAVTARAADGSRRPVEAAVEQFDLQPPSAVVYGFDRGWHEQEFAPATGRLWRWMTGEATVRVHATTGPIRAVIRGESTRRYFDRPSRLVLRAGPLVLGELQPEADFVWEVPVALDALRAAGDVLSLSTDQTFVPDERTGNGDRRRLGVRVYDLRVRAENAHVR